MESFGGTTDQRAPRRHRRWWPLVTLVGVGAVVATVMAVRSGDPADGDRVSLEDLAPPEECVVLDDVDLPGVGPTALASGLVAGAGIGPVWMVTLDSPEVAAAVAALVVHPDLDEPAVGMWVVRREVGPPDGVVAANDIARRYSDWPAALAVLDPEVGATLERCARWVPGFGDPPAVDELGDLGDGVEVVAASDERPYALAVRSRRVGDDTPLVCVELTLPERSATGCGAGAAPISVATTSGPDGTWTFGSAPPDATIVELSDGDHVIATASVTTSPELPQLGVWATDQPTVDARFVAAYDDTRTAVAAVTIPPSAES